jgi:hypothetical protein
MTVFSSPMTFNPEDNAPQELDANGIMKVIEDFIIIARVSLRDPYFALHCARVLEEDWPLQYKSTKL